MTTDRTRRTLLGGIASTVAGLAGCLTGEDPPRDGAASSSSPFAKISVKGTELVVELRDDVKVDVVNVIGPEGEEFASSSVATGASQVSVNLSVGYSPGEHRIVASQGNTKVGESSMTIEPNIQFTRIVVGENSAASLPEDLEYAEEQLVIEVKNTGNGPEALTKLLVQGDVPNPTDEIESENVSGIYDSSDGAGMVSEIVIPAGSQKRIFSTTKPFLFGGEGGIECKNSTFTAEGSVTLQSKLSDRIETEVGIRYSPTTDGECNSTIISTG